jgi:transcriptional regulator GlxA family with amidase domain
MLFIVRMGGIIAVKPIYCAEIPRGRQIHTHAHTRTHTHTNSLSAGSSTVQQQQYPDILYRADSRGVRTGAISTGSFLSNSCLLLERERKK